MKLVMTVSMIVLATGTLIQHERSQIRIMTSQSTYKPGLLIPLYKYPVVSSGSCSDSDYQTVGNSAIASRTIVILNPNNGPRTDAAGTSAYNTCISFLRSKGVKVVGYVHTKVGYPNISGYRSYSDVVSDINYWASTFTIDGIFVDEVTNQWPTSSYDSKAQVLQYYGNLTTFIQQTYATYLVILNPGSVYYNELALNKGANVIAVMYETDANHWNPTTGDCINLLWTTAQGQFSKGPWCMYVPNWDGIEQLKTLVDNGAITRGQSAALIYSVSSSQVSTIISQGLNQNIGYFYLTERGLSNVWSGLASSAVWTATVAALNI